MTVQEPVKRSARKPTTLLLDEDLVAEARRIGVDVNRAAEAGLRERMREAEAWKRENAAAIESYNAWIEENGLPLEEYRQF